MTEVVLGFFQNAADSLLFCDVVVQFMNVTFCLFSPLAFRFGACSFSELGLTRRLFYLTEVASVQVTITMMGTLRKA